MNSENRPLWEVGVPGVGGGGVVGLSQFYQYSAGQRTEGSIDTRNCIPPCPNWRGDEHAELSGAIRYLLGLRGIFMSRSVAPSSSQYTRGLSFLADLTMAPRTSGINPVEASFLPEAQQESN